MKIIKKNDKFYQVFKIEQEITEDYLMDQLFNINNIISNGQQSDHLLLQKKEYEFALSKIKAEGIFDKIKNLLNI